MVDCLSTVVAGGRTVGLLMAHKSSLGFWFSWAGLSLVWWARFLLLLLLDLGILGL